MNLIRIIIYFFMMNNSESGMEAIDRLTEIRDREYAENIRELSDCFVAQIDPLKVILFGSFADGSYTADSDYDFVISKGDISSYISYMAFIHALEDALGRHVDVVTDTSDDPKFLDSIKKDEILLYERL